MRRAFTACVNPISGSGEAALVWEAVGGSLQDLGFNVETVTTESRVHAEATAADAAARGRIVVAVGGDGLVRDVAAGVAIHQGILAVVPAGRGNDFAAALRLPKTTNELSELLLSAEPQMIDALLVNGTLVVGNAYCGIDAVANRIINSMRWLPGVVAYRVAPFLSVLQWRARNFTVEIDGARTSLRSHLVAVGKSGMYGNGLHMIPGASLRGGKARAMLVRAPLTAIVAFLRQAKTGAHAGRSDVEFHDGNSFVIEADRPTRVYGDGEDLGLLPAVISVRENALQVLAPKSAR
ncbi:diacylglycerol/lipid kinase family protein [Humidisolicoccus flavus]|uniref:diacylglycerol/lipid kinase family protein n=1 Tax=Humidisolicoccus flavus TaxID=3111414 RepID=UPI00324A7F14